MAFPDYDPPFFGGVNIQPDQLQHPWGRTGLAGRGDLPEFGPNTTRAFLITRYVDKHQSGIEFVAVWHKGKSAWLLPGPQVVDDFSKPVYRSSSSWINELGVMFVDSESVKQDEDSIQSFDGEVKESLSSQRPEVYDTAVNDTPRGTDHAWEELTVRHVHDASGVTHGCVLRLTSFPLYTENEESYYYIHTEDVDILKEIKDVRLDSSDAVAWLPCLPHLQLWGSTETRVLHQAEAKLMRRLRGSRDRLY